MTSTKEKLPTQYNDAVKQIKTAILQSQAKALKGVNQEQLALYYGIGRFISYNSREGFWGKGAIATISEQLRREIPGLRGFSPSNLKSMRAVSEEWKSLEATSPVMTGELQVADSENNKNSTVTTGEFLELPVDSLLEYRLYPSLHNYHEGERCRGAKILYPALCRSQPVR